MLSYKMLEKEGFIALLKAEGVADFSAAEKAGLMEFDQYINEGHDWGSDPMGECPHCDIIEPYWFITSKGQELLDAAIKSGRIKKSSSIFRSWDVGGDL